MSITLSNSCIKLKIVVVLILYWTLDLMRKHHGRVWTPSTEEFCEIINDSISISDALRKLGLRINGGNPQTLKDRIEYEGISIEHFNPNQAKGWQKRAPLEEILRNGREYKGYKLKQILVEELGVIEECSICGIGNIWNGISLSLQIDHVNGIHNDNRIENLRLLCPNYHSQTETFAGRNT